MHRGSEISHKIYRTWRTARREFSLERALVMGILNVTPDSFSDGGNFVDAESELRQAEKMIAEGADIIDIGGESTRPNSTRVSAEEEISRVVPIIETLVKNFDISISIDTSKAKVAAEAMNAGADIINDISGLRFDEKVGEVAARCGSGLILMHLRGEFETMHSQPPVSNILEDVAPGLRQSLEKAENYGVAEEKIALDIGIGFGKTLEQNLELLAKLDQIIAEFPNFPMLVGTSRKSFIGKILGGAPVSERLYGSLATTATAIWNGAKIIRAHDVKATVETVKIVEAVKNQL